MLRSLFSGISGLRVNQTALDVTGNNIANANTTGFKSSTTVFQDTMSQLMTPAGANNGNNGGTNPVQVGLGVQVAATNTNYGQGSEQPTGRPTDMMISGDGMFVVQKGNQQLFTRSGAFSFDNTGVLVTPTGNKVQGYRIDPGTGAGAGPLVDITLDPANAVPAVPAGVTMTSYSIGTDGKVTGVFSDGQRRDLAQIAIANFTNVQGLEKVGESSYRVSANSGQPAIGLAGAEGRGLVKSGSLEMSNVDLAAEFTNLILAQRGFQASSRVITTSDQVLEELVNIKR